MGMEVGLFASFSAGVLSFLSPCILPLVPPYLCFIAGASLDELTRTDPRPGTTHRAFARALAFVAGFAAVFVALGASASTVGRLVLEHLTLLSQVAGAIIVVLGLHMLGVFRLAPLMREARVQVANRPASLVGAFVVGLAFAFGWTPCVGPVLASVLMIAGAQESAREGAALLGAYAAGIGLPFLAAALFTEPFLRLLARVRRYLGTVEKVMGTVLVITGVLIFMGAMPIVSNWLLETFPVLGRIG